MRWVLLNTKTRNARVLSFSTELPNRDESRYSCSYEFCRVPQLPQRVTESLRRSVFPSLCGAPLRSCSYRARSEVHPSRASCRIHVARTPTEPIRISMLLRPRCHRWKRAASCTWTMIVAAQEPARAATLHRRIRSTRARQWLYSGLSAYLGITCAGSIRNEKQVKSAEERI